MIDKLALERPVYETPHLTLIEVSVTSVLCLSDGVSLDGLEEYEENW